jgi:hypothetical protein
VFRTVGKLHEVLMVIDASQVQDAAVSHDARAMHAKTPGWIELLSEAIHGPAQEMRAAVNVQVGLVSGCPNPFGIVGDRDLKA